MFLALTAVVAFAAQPDPIIAAVKGKLKDPAKPFTMTVTVKVKPGQEAAFEAAFAACRKETRKEAGNVAYDLNRDTDQPETYVLYERWQNLDALAAHMEAAHTKKLLGALSGFLEGPPAIKVYLAVGE
jgi:quinol monooxygenase YgiN